MSVILDDTPDYKPDSPDAEAPSFGEAVDVTLPAQEPDAEQPAHASLNATSTPSPTPDAPVEGSAGRPDDEMPVLEDRPDHPDRSAEDAARRTCIPSILAAASGFRQEPESEPVRIESRLERTMATRVAINVGTAEGPVSVFTEGEEHAYDEAHDRILPGHELTRAATLFVPCEGLDAVLSQLNLPTGGLCLVVGPDHGGKYMTALNLALRLRASQAAQGDALTVCCYTNPMARALSLPRFASKAPENRIYIIRDAFEHGYPPERLLSEHALIIDALLRRRIYLILTTEEPAASFAEIASPKVEIKRPAMAAVLQSHLAYYERYCDNDLITAVRGLLQRVTEHLEYPTHADLFCTRLTAIASDEITEDRILETARRVARVGRSAVRAWFRRLSANHRLYALFVGLFSGIKGPLLDELYIRAIGFLRHDGLTALKDPRSLGIADIRQRINVHIDPDRRLPPDLDVTFSLPAYEREVYEQIGNYNLTLWSLRGVFIELMREHSAPELWRFRQVLASAIGVVCAAHRERFSEVLQEIALDRSRPVVATAGFVMAEACKRESARRQDVLELLHSWVKSQRPALMWAAGAAVWRVYPDVTTEVDSEPDSCSLGSFRADLLDTLRLLGLHAKQISEAERRQLWERCRALGGDSRAAFGAQLEAWQNLNYHCFVFAVERVFTLDPVTISEQLERWLLDRNGLLAWLSREACLNLFLGGRDPNDRFPIEQQNQMLRLIHPLLRSGRDVHHGPIEEALETVRLWLEWGGCDRERILASLLPIANDQDPQISFLLRRLLASSWLDSECKEAQEVARRLIGRSIALQGCPMHPPGSAHGVLVLDGSSRGMAEGTSARAAVLLRALLDSQLDTTLVQLGRQERFAGPEESVSTLDLRRRASRSRLLIPALEALGERRISLLLILSWGEVLDQADLADCLEVDDVRLVAAGYQPAEDNPLDVFRLRSAISWPDLHRLEAWLTWTRARRVADCDYAEWEPELARHLGLASGDDLSRKLSERAAHLDEVSEAAGRNDLVRLLNTAFLWWLEADPEACLGLLNRWLDKDGPEPLRRLAVAAGRQIFFVMAHRKRTLGRAFQESLLGCASALVTSGWFGAEAVFYMARHLLPDPRWQGLLVDGADGCSQPLATWFAALTLEHEQPLRDLLVVWGHRLIEEDVLPAVLSEVIPRLRQQISLGSGNLLELIDTEEPYFVIAVDGSLPNQAVRRHICDLTRGVAGLLKEKGRKVLVHRLGSATPIATADREILDETLYPPGLHRLPRLVAPLVEGHDVTRVGALLLILFDDVLDGADIGVSPWVDKIKVCAVANRASGMPFFRIPPGDVESVAGHLLTP